MQENTIAVAADFLERVAKKNCCSTLNMEKSAQSKGQVIAWRGRMWVCTGSVSSHHKTIEADLREVVLEENYHGSPNHPKARGVPYYTGGRLRSLGKTWVMTGFEIQLVPSSEEQPAQLSLL